MGADMKLCFVLMIIIFSVHFAGNAWAVQCYEESSAHAGKGDAYYDLEKERVLTSDEKNAIARLAKALKGEWHGSGSEFFCKGTEKNPRPVSTGFGFKMTVSVSSKYQLRLENRKRWLVQKKSRTDVFKLLGKDSNTQGVQISENRLTVTEKYRRPGVIGKGEGSVFWEIIHELRLEDKQLRFNTTRYVNGYLSSKETRRYTR